MVHTKIIRIRHHLRPPLLLPPKLLPPPEGDPKPERDGALYDGREPEEGVECSNERDCPRAGAADLPLVFDRFPVLFTLREERLPDCTFPTRWPVEVPRYTGRFVFPSVEKRRWEAARPVP